MEVLNETKLFMQNQMKLKKSVEIKVEQKPNTSTNKQMTLSQILDKTEENEFIDLTLES